MRLHHFNSQADARPVSGRCNFDSVFRPSSLFRNSWPKMVIILKFYFLTNGERGFFSEISMTAVIITNWHEGWPYFEYITLNSNYISGHTLKIISFFKHVIFECLAISIEVIQGHRTLNFRDRSLKRENFRKNLNEQKIDFKSFLRGNRPHRSRFLSCNLARTSPSGARGRIWSKFTSNDSTSNYLPSESSWHEKNEKISSGDI